MLTRNGWGGMTSLVCCRKDLGEGETSESGMAIQLTIRYDNLCVGDGRQVGRIVEGGGRGRMEGG